MIRHLLRSANADPSSKAGSHLLAEIKTEVADAGNNKETLYLYLLDCSGSTSNKPNGADFVRDVVNVCAGTSEPNVCAGLFGGPTVIDVTKGMGPFSLVQTTLFAPLIAWLEEKIAAYKQHCKVVKIRLVGDGAFLDANRAFTPSPIMAIGFERLALFGVQCELHVDLFLAHQSRQTIQAYYAHETRVADSLECRETMTAVAMVANRVFRVVTLSVMTADAPTMTGRVPQAHITRQFTELDSRCVALSTAHVATCGILGDVKDVRLSDHETIRRLVNAARVLCAELVGAHQRNEMVIEVGNRSWFVNAAAAAVQCLADQITVLQDGDPLQITFDHLLATLTQAGFPASISRLTVGIDAQYRPKKFSQAEMDQMATDSRIHWFGAEHFAGVLDPNKPVQCLVLPHTIAAGGDRRQTITAYTHSYPMNEVRNFGDVLPIFDVRESNPAAQQFWRIRARQVVCVCIQNPLLFPQGEKSSTIPWVLVLLCLMAGAGSFELSSIALALLTAQSYKEMVIMFATGLVSACTLGEIRCILQQLHPLLGFRLTDAEIHSLVLAAIEPGRRHRAVHGLPCVDRFLAILQGTCLRSVCAELESREPWTIDSLFAGDATPVLPGHPTIKILSGVGVYVEFSGMQPVTFVIRDQLTLSILLEQDPSLLLSIVGPPGIGKSATSLMLYALLLWLQGRLDTYVKSAPLRPDANGRRPPHICRLQDEARRGLLSMMMEYPGPLIADGVNPYKSGNRQSVMVRNICDGPLSKFALSTLCMQGVCMRNEENAPRTPPSGLLPEDAASVVDSICAKRAGPYSSVECPPCIIDAPRTWVISGSGANRTPPDHLKDAACVSGSALDLFLSVLPGHHRERKEICAQSKPVANTPDLPATQPNLPRMQPTSRPTSALDPPHVQLMPKSASAQDATSRPTSAPDPPHVQLMPESASAQDAFLDDFTAAWHTGRRWALERGETLFKNNKTALIRVPFWFGKDQEIAPFLDTVSRFIRDTRIEYTGNLPESADAKKREIGTNCLLALVFTASIFRQLLANIGAPEIASVSAHEQQRLPNALKNVMRVIAGIAAGRQDGWLYPGVGYKDPRYALLSGARVLKTFVNTQDWRDFIH